MANRKGVEKLADHEKHHARERKIQDGLDRLLIELGDKCPEVRKIIRQEHKVLTYLPDQHFITIETSTARYGICYRAHQLGMKGTGTFVYDFPKR